MTILKKTGTAICMVATACALHAQNVTMTSGGQTRFKMQKGGDVINLHTGGNSYFLTTAFEQAVMKYYIEGYDASGAPIAQRQLEVDPGVFNNSYGIDDVVAVGGKLYALVEHLDKPSGKNSLAARQIGNGGNISKEETQLMSIAFEKTMNSGYNYSTVSEDQATLAVVGLLPYEKEASAKLKIAVYDKDLKKKNESEVTIPGEDTKNKNIKVVAGNDGTVYVIRQTSMKNGEMVLDIYQYTGTAELKPYHFEMTGPNYFTTYAYTVNPAGELVMAGTYYERKTVSTGDRKASGIFYFTNKEKSEQVFQTFPLSAPVDNLTARKVLVNGNTIFLTAEQYKEEKIAPPAGTTGAAAFDYSYNYTHRNEYVIAVDADGNKKFELNMQKDFTARDFDKQYYSAYYIVNGKLTVIYNDRAQKYTQNSSYSIVPVLTQITNDGLMQSPVVFIDKLRLPNYNMVFPAFSLQRSPGEVAMLMRYNEDSRYLNLKID